MTNAYKARGGKKMRIYRRALYRERKLEWKRRWERCGVWNAR